tara:strand:- start:1644 stop:2078 length:435 start_codon:yes stop_codon:yes gene_type:complete
MKINDLALTSAGDLALTQPDETISKAATVMTTRNIGALPVIDQSGDLIGIISERDIVHGFSERRAALNDQKVSDLMTTDVITCHLDDEVNEIMAEMQKHNIRHVPVLDASRLFSIISSRDLMAAVLKETKAHFHTLGLAYETVR